MVNETTQQWKDQLNRCLNNYDYVVSPRDMEVREVISGSYVVPMPAYINLKERKVNVPFMFQEAAWILSGSNRLSDLTKYLKGYAAFSDDLVFMKGAYGPKVVDQLPYVIESLQSDFSSRQAVINIWRERPGKSRDIPCTLSMQFLIRDSKLNMVVTMRSQDIVRGYTFDVFTFSMVAAAVQRLLLEVAKVQVELGDLFVNAGSLHLYSDYYDKAISWTQAESVDDAVGVRVQHVLDNSRTYIDLVNNLLKEAGHAKVET